MSYAIVVLLICLLANYVFSFNIINTTQNAQSFYPGETLTLVCQSDTHWEYCIWKQKRTVYQDSEPRECLMEWKRSKGGVKIQNCNEELAERITVAGDYDKNECGLELTELELADGGMWECEMEEYKFTDLVAGAKHSKTFTISVQDKTSTSTETITFAVTTEIALEDTTEEQIRETTEDSDPTEFSSTPEAEEDSTEDMTTVLNENTIALPMEKEEPEQTSAGPIAGISVSVVALFAGLGVVGFMWKRKQRSVNGVSLQKLRDEESYCTNPAVEGAEVTKVTMHQLMDTEK